MLYREIYQELENWKIAPKNQVLLITGARQVGKTTSIRQFAKKSFKNFIEINLLENEDAKTSLSNAKNTKDFFLRLSTFCGVSKFDATALLFIDEIQESPDIITRLKFVLENSDLRIIISGSMLGVELGNIRSFPVGYLRVLTMYPLNFKEFLIANNISGISLEEAEDAFNNLRPVHEAVNNTLFEYMYKYIAVGGMPDCVNAYLSTNNINNVRQIQKSIVDTYRIDISKYAGDRNLIVKNIFDLIAPELAKQNKRFVSASLGDSHTGRFANDFLWLTNANVALPVFAVSEARCPLLAYQKNSYFKLFSSDVGLLTSQYGFDTSKALINKKATINFGAIYENFVAQELVAKQIKPYYFSKKQFGEVDFLFQRDNKITVLEVKSGNYFKRHAALDNLLKTKNFKIDKAYVLCESNLEVAEKVTYLPAWMAMWV